MMYRLLVKLSLFVIILCQISHLQSKENWMNKDEIEKQIIGRRIYLAVPFGGEFPLNYYKNGELDGSGEAVGLGKFMQPQDKGKWWISEDRLCQQWLNWYDKKIYCFQLKFNPPKKLLWVRNDGLTGDARISN